MSAAGKGTWHGTTILSVRKDGQVVIGGDGQVSLLNTILKPSARTVRRLAGGKIIAGFAGSTADALTLLERLETKLERHPGQLTRAAVELAKDWRTDRYLRRLEAMMAVADAEVSLLLTGQGESVLRLRVTTSSRHLRSSGTSVVSLPNVFCSSSASGFVS